MTSSRAIQPMLDPHYHYGHSNNLNGGVNGALGPPQGPNTGYYSQPGPQYSPYAVPGGGGGYAYDSTAHYRPSHLQVPGTAPPGPPGQYYGPPHQQQQQQLGPGPGPPHPHSQPPGTLAPSSYSTSPYARPGRQAGAPQGPEGGHHPQQGQQYHYDRRFSHPQLGYYDLITGEYRYHRSDSNFNTSPMMGGSNYAGETEPPMCENTCRCCQIKLPFNYLTISLITCLMLLLMFSLFKATLGNKTTKPNTTVNAKLFHEMIWITGGFAAVFMVLIIVKYVFTNPHSPFYCAACARCRLFDILLSTGQSSVSMMGYGPHDQSGHPGARRLSRFPSMVNAKNFYQQRLSTTANGTNAQQRQRGEDFV